MPISRVTLALTVLALLTTQECSGQTPGSVRSINRTQACEQPHLQEIRQVVQEHATSGELTGWKGELEAVLDNRTVEYRQLEPTDSVWDVGEYGFTQLARLLLCAGLSPDASTSGGRTMLHGASRSGMVDLVEVLVDAGADVDARDARGRTPLMDAAWSDEAPAARRLVELGAQISARDEDGRSAFDVAASRGHGALAQYLARLPR